MDVLRKCGSVGEAREHVLAVRRMCAAVRASLETHIRAEEAELWPLFTEHFSTEEQQYLVGVIIGRTGAQVCERPRFRWGVVRGEGAECVRLLVGSYRGLACGRWLSVIV